MLASELQNDLIVKFSNSGQVPKLDFLSALGIAVDEVSKRLWKRNSDLLRNSTTLIYPAGRNKMVVATRLLGIIDKPKINGIELDRLPKDYDVTITGNPIYCELLGTGLSIYPIPVETVSVLVKYAALPQVCSINEPLPFNGILDWVISEATSIVAIAGLTSIADPGFNALLVDGIDSFVSQRTQKPPSYRPRHYF